MNRVSKSIAVAVFAFPGVASADALTGFYLGGQIGSADIGSSLGVTGSGESGGLFAGYNFEVGRNGILGAEFDVDSTNYNLSGGAGTVDRTYRLKARGGGRVGGGFLYGTAGWARAETSALGNGNGYFYGIGYDFPVNDVFSIGGELLRHELDGFNAPGLNTTVDTLKIRFAYSF